MKGKPMSDCPDYVDPQTVDPPPYTGWIDPSAPYTSLPTDSNGLFYVTPAFDDPYMPPLVGSDCDWLIDIDDDTPDADHPQSLMEKSLRIHIRHIRLRLRREDYSFWLHIRSLYHQRKASEAIQEMLHWESVHPE